MLINSRILLAAAVVFSESLLVTSMPHPAKQAPTNSGSGGRRTSEFGKRKPRLPPITTNISPVTRHSTIHVAEDHSPSRHYQPEPHWSPAAGKESDSPWDETSPLHGSYDSEFEKDNASMLKYIGKYQDGGDPAAVTVAKYVFPCKS